MIGSKKLSEIRRSIVHRLAAEGVDQASVHTKLQQRGQLVQDAVTATTTLTELMAELVSAAPRQQRSNKQ